MFALLRNLVSPAHEEEPKPLLPEVGGHITFGKLPQKSLSRQRARFTSLQTYQFNGESFAAYHMDVGSTHHQMILSGAKGNCTLALSQLIDERIFNLLFVDYMPEEWFDLEVGETLKAEPAEFSALAGWLASAYNVVMHTHGNISGEESQMFDYVLLADEHNRFALEAECYMDGSLRVFATVYRPASDIVCVETAPPLAMVEAFPYMKQKFL